MNLDLVLGMSSNNTASLTCDQNSGLVAHTASGVLVVLNTKMNSQVKYFHVRKNCVSSASFSHDGRYVTTGETGYRPAVRVWRIKDGQEVATLYGHEFGIKCVQFCPTMSEIVSVGLEHDNVVNVWAWPSGHRVATNNIVDVIRAVAYSECGRFFITAGCRHIKFWYPKMTIAQSKLTGKNCPLVQPLYGRLGILGDCKENMFIDVVCGNGDSSDSVFAITQAGELVTLSANDRQLKSHKNVEGVKGTCIKVHDRVIFIGFNNGDIHMFNATNLAHLGALPVPTFFRRTGLKSGGVLTLTFNLSTSFLTAAYKNSSMCVWDMQDASNVKQKYVAVYHSAPIVNIDTFRSSSRARPDSNIPRPARETLVTVAQDSTVRLWGVLIDTAICHDRLSIFYSDDGCNQSQDSFVHATSSNNTLQNGVSGGVVCGGNGTGGGVGVGDDGRDGDDDGVGCGKGNGCGSNSPYSCLRTGRPRQRKLTNSGVITTIKVSPDLTLLVTGNKAGNICVYEKDSYLHRHTVRLHSREVTCLAFYCNMTLGHLALVSGSRDRLIHVMDAHDNFRLVSTLNIHSSSIMALRVSQVEGVVRIVSASSDRSVSVSEALAEHLPMAEAKVTTRPPSPVSTPTTNGMVKCSTPPSPHPSHHRKVSSTFQLVNVAAYVSSPTDIAVDVHSVEMAVGFQDGTIRVLDMKLLQEQRAFPGSVTTEAQVYKVDLDSYGALLLSATSDKTINVLNFRTGDILHTVTGHNKCVTGLVFTSNGDHVVSTSMDGCVFLWRLTSDLLAKRRDIDLAAKRVSPVGSPFASLLAVAPGSANSQTARSATAVVGGPLHARRVCSRLSARSDSSYSLRRRMHSAPPRDRRCISGGGKWRVGELGGEGGGGRERASRKTKDSLLYIRPYSSPPCIDGARWTRLRSSSASGRHSRTALSVDRAGRSERSLIRGRGGGGGKGKERVNESNSGEANNAKRVFAERLGTSWTVLYSQNSPGSLCSGCDSYTVRSRASARSLSRDGARTKKHKDSIRWSKSVPPSPSVMREIHELMDNLVLKNRNVLLDNNRGYRRIVPLVLRGKDASTETLLSSEKQKATREKMSKTMTSPHLRPSVLDRSLAFDKTLSPCRARAPTPSDKLSPLDS